MLGKCSTLFLLIICLKPNCQKYDYNWILGSKYNNTADSCQYGMVLNFEKEFKIKRRLISRTMEPHNNSISDIEGNLQFYTNGCSIVNFDDKVIENGDSLNPTYDYGFFCEVVDGQQYGIPYPNASLFLPQEDGKIMYLSLETKTNPTKLPHVYSPNVLKTLIDTKFIEAHAIYKNTRILSNNYTLSRFGLNACKHIDKKSWWVICRRDNDSLFHILLVKNDTIFNRTQSIGNFYLRNDISQSTFSPDGKFYIWYSKAFGLEIMHFDRELGLLSNYLKISVVDTSSLGYGGLAISPNNRFVYVSTRWDLYQYDLESTNISNSIEHIKHCNETESSCNNGKSFNILYYQMQLGPDCRIYMTKSTPEAIYLNVILYPDRKGKDCQFIESGIKLPSYNFKSLPQFPNYRIDQPYPCDSTIKLVTSNLELGDDYLITNVYPNPVNDILQLDVELHGEKEAKFSLLDVNGKYVIVRAISGFASNFSFDISHLSSGIYFYTIATKKGNFKNGKIVKL